MEQAENVIFKMSLVLRQDSLLKIAEQVRTNFVLLFHVSLTCPSFRTVSVVEMAGPAGMNSWDSSDFLTF